jgi:hypothetical protein
MVLKTSSSNGFPFPPFAGTEKFDFTSDQHQAWLPCFPASKSTRCQSPRGACPPSAQHNGSPPVGASGVSSIQTMQLPVDRNFKPASIAQTWAERKGLANFLEQKWLRPNFLHLEASGVLDSRTPREIVLDLPYNQLCVFARSYESSKPLQVSRQSPSRVEPHKGEIQEREKASKNKTLLG